ncbi:MAG: GDYXXLXY domain-containing protein [Paraglaciecola sp.]|uniref:GDYXXLXY domain-containing protein n=1 Tax=Paraglaciecola sp. TaxID=1920173 RepID=UPI003299EF9F
MKHNVVMWLTGAVILILINLSIWQKEAHLDEGEVIYLELAPVDPRSLMQGDYMALRYKLSNSVYTALTGVTDTDNNQEWQDWNNQGLSATDGYLIAEKDQNNVMKFVRLDNAEAMTASQRKLQFRFRDKRVKFATNAFFFSEGDGALYEDARYGVFRLNTQGEVLLTGMLNEQFNELGNQ